MRIGWNRLSVRTRGEICSVLVAIVLFCLFLVPFIYWAHYYSHPWNW